MKQKEKQTDDSFTLLHNVKGEQVEDWVQSFEVNEFYRQRHRTNGNVMYHEVLSFHDADTNSLTVSIIQDLTRKYIDLRNPNGMYVAELHTDQDHWHVHVACSAIEFRTGKTISLSRKEFKDLKVQLQDYQQERYPELSHSVVRHGEGKSKSKHAEHYFQERKQPTQKERLDAALKQAFGMSKTKEEFLANIEQHGISVYMRGGRTSGLVYENRRFRFKSLGYQDKFQLLEEVKERNQELQSLRNQTDNHGRLRQLDEMRESSAEPQKPDNSVQQEQSSKSAAPSQPSPPDIPNR